MVTGLLISRATRCCKEAQTETKGEAMSHPVEKLAVQTVTVPEDQTLEQLIAANEYRYRSRNITSEHFPDIGPRGDFELVLIQINRECSTEEVITEVRRLGFEPAYIGQLLVFSAKCRSEGIKFHAAALGIAWFECGEKRYQENDWWPVINQENEFHALYLREDNHVWNEGIDFLAYRKKEAEAEKTPEEKSAPFRIHDDEFELTFPGYVSPSELVLVGLTRPVTGTELLERLREAGVQLATADQIHAWERENHERSKGLIELREDEVVVKEADKKELPLLKE